MNNRTLSKNVVCVSVWVQRKGKEDWEWELCDPEDFLDYLPELLAAGDTVRIQPFSN